MSTIEKVMEDLYYPWVFVNWDAIQDASGDDMTTWGWSTKISSSRIEVAGTQTMSPGPNPGEGF